MTRSISGAKNAAGLDLVSDYSLEMTAKDVPGLIEAKGQHSARHTDQHYVPGE